MPAVDAVHHAFIAALSAGSLAAANVSRPSRRVICLPARASSDHADSQAPVASTAPVLMPAPAV